MRRIRASVSPAISSLRLSSPDVDIALESTELEVTGKRGEARLGFRMTAAGEPVGQGAKTLILSGLRAYEPEALRGLVERYAGWKATGRAGV
ncbi:MULTISPECIES: DUF3581 family protein [unclassified Thiocapsa]|uniref:DUF3581 family protein n=1 Tax=unclassified Thiocapsa TaxID=2641286 RepID=UPI0035B3CF51